MNFFNGILLSGWFQIILLSFGFFIYSRAILQRKLIRGYALGWMLGLFFIFAYTALNPPQRLYLGGFDRELTLPQVIFASVLGVFVSLGMALISSVLRENYRWHALRAASITAILVTAIFIQIIAEPGIRLMASIFVLALASTALMAFILRRGDRSSVELDSAAYTGYDDQENGEEPTSRVSRLRQRIANRVNRNDVPTNRSISP